MYNYAIDQTTAIAGLAVLASVFASIIALYGAWRANKIAEKNLSASVELQLIQFREKWISELREEMAGFSASITSPHYGGDILAKMLSHFHKISLLMNDEDPLYPLLMMQLAQISKAAVYRLETETNNTMLSAENAFKASPKEFPFLNDEAFNINIFEKISRNILKNEWERVKTDMRKYNAKNQ